MLRLCKNIITTCDFISNKKYKDWDIIRSLWESTNESKKFHDYIESKFSNQYQLKIYLVDTFLVFAIKNCELYVI